MNDTLLTGSIQPKNEDYNPINNIDIPEKFKDPDTGSLRANALLKSYLALEKKLSSERPMIPETPEAYCINCAHGLFSPDTDINTRLHAKGFTQEQAQEVYDLAAEKLVPLIMDIAAEFQAERELDRLQDHFGGTEKWREISSQLLQFGQKNLPPELLKGLASSYEGVMALYQMMSGDQIQQAPSPRADVKAAVNEDDLHSLMRSPKYWREKDPSVIAKVTKGFQNLYGR